MKKILLSILTVITINSINAQTEDDSQITCYQKYAEVFEKRGAEDVDDGTYNDVIITFRKGSMADCFYGKVSVKNGAIITDEMYLKFVDDAYEKVVRKFRDPSQVIKVINGMSRTMVTADDELIDVLFTKKIKPKKKSYVRAADPDFDF